MMIPTAYGRSGESLYIHGSTEEILMLNQIIDGQTACISVTHLDGLVLAKSLFHSSVNYRSAVLFGKAILVDDENERIEGMKVITENIRKGRWDEVQLGTEAQLKLQLVIKI
jgi:nitroimidazol reductase NimA-like FMN-containing flavoprotein (pyridoxamine 5'-phosphate oxidase superfamily)